MLDDIDRNILSLLQADASASYAALGRAVGLSVSAVNERVKKLEARGVLAGYTVRLDGRALGLGLTAFVQVSLNDPRQAKAVLDAATAEPAVLELHAVTGAHAYLLKVRCADVAALNAILSETLKALPGVSRTETLVVLDTLKETAALPVGGGVDPIS